MAATITCARAPRAPFALRISGVIACLVLTAAALIPVVRWGDPAGAPVVDGLQTFGTAIVGAAVVTELVGEYRVRRSVRDLVRRLSVAEFSWLSPRSVSAVEFAVPRDSRWVDASGRLLTGGANERAAVLRGRTVRPYAWCSAGGPRPPRSSPRSRRPADSPWRTPGCEPWRNSGSSISEPPGGGSSRRPTASGGGSSAICMMGPNSGSSPWRCTSNSAGPSVDTGSASPWARRPDQVREALAALRRLSHDSLASVLTAEGLLAATEDLVADAPLTVVDRRDLVTKAVPAPIQATAYLTASVALDNVVAHAIPTRRAVRSGRESGGLLVVEVTDHGVGGATRVPG